VDEHKKHKDFRLRDASFKGEGIDPALAHASWDRLRDIAYEGRGG
jgi:hypothetical protein